MLVLSRKLNEKIIIRDRNGQVIAKVCVVRTNHNGKVRLGIEADRSISVHREEIDNIIQGKTMATVWGPVDVPGK